MAKTIKKRQFKHTAKPLPFFDRRFRSAGGTKVLSLGKILPHDWYFVRITVEDRDAESVTIRIKKLLCDGNGTSNSATNKRRKQNS